MILANRLASQILYITAREPAEKRFFCRVAAHHFANEKTTPRDSDITPGIQACPVRTVDRVIVCVVEEIELGTIDGKTFDRAKSPIKVSRTAQLSQGISGQPTSELRIVSTKSRVYQISIRRMQKPSKPKIRINISSGFSPCTKGRVSFPGFPGHPARRVSSGIVHGIEDQTKAEKARGGVQT